MGKFNHFSILYIKFLVYMHLKHFTESCKRNIASHWLHSIKKPTPSRSLLPADSWSASLLESKSSITVRAGLLLSNNTLFSISSLYLFKGRCFLVGLLIGQWLSRVAQDIFSYFGIWVRGFFITLSYFWGFIALFTSLMLDKNMTLFLISWLNFSR